MIECLRHEGYSPVEPESTRAHFDMTLYNCKLR